MKRSSVTLSATAHEIVRHLHPDVKRSVREALDYLSKNPFAGKPLKRELEGLWSLPVAHYRGRLPDREFLPGDCVHRAEARCLRKAPRTARWQIGPDQILTARL